MSSTLTQTVVIIGAGLAGGNAAVTLREEGWRGRVILLGAEPTLPFGRPPLSKTYLRGEEKLDSWYVRPADWYDQQNVERRVNTMVQHVDTGLKQLSLAGGEVLAYDKLVLCTGGSNRRLSMPGEDLVGIYQLRSLAQCEAIRNAARPGARVVIVGMGFIGSELAASLHQMGLHVTVVLSGTAPLEKVLGHEAGSVLAAIHREHSIQMVINDRVTGFEGHQRVERVLTASGARIECDLVVVSAGILPETSMLAGSGIAVKNGVLVDAYCRTNVPDVFAAGDVANTLHPLFGRVRVEHFNNAERQGKAVAHTLLGRPQQYDYVYSFWSDQYEHSLEYVGFVNAWERIVVRGDYEARKFLIFYLKGGVVCATFGLDRGGDPELSADTELHACQQLIARRARLPEEVLADESIDLHSLVK